jgi:hypothetical protein
MAKRRKPPPSPPVPPSQGWTAPLARPIRLKDGTQFHSLGDAARFVLALPNHLQDRNSWRRATELLLEAAEHGGGIEAATEQFELALFLEARTCGSNAKKPRSEAGLTVWS